MLSHMHSKSDVFVSHTIVVKKCQSGGKTMSNDLFKKKNIYIKTFGTDWTKGRERDSIATIQRPAHCPMLQYFCWITFCMQSNNNTVLPGLITQSIHDQTKQAASSATCLTRLLLHVPWARALRHNKERGGSGSHYRGPGKNSHRSEENSVTAFISPIRGSDKREGGKRDTKRMRGGRGTSRKVPERRKKIK